MKRLTLCIVAVVALTACGASIDGSNGNEHAGEEDGGVTNGPDEYGCSQLGQDPNNWCDPGCYYGTDGRAVHDAAGGCARLCSVDRELLWPASRIGSGTCFSDTSLNIGLAASPSSYGIANDNEHVASLGLTFATNGGVENAHLVTVVLQGQGSLDGVHYSHEAFRSIVQSCRLAVNTAAYTVDASPSIDGATMTFDGMDLIIWNGTAVTLTVQCSPFANSSTVGASYFIGVTSVDQILARDNQYYRVNANVSPILLNQASGDTTPAVVINLF